MLCNLIRSGPARSSSRARRIAFVNAFIFSYLCGLKRLRGWRQSKKLGSDWDLHQISRAQGSANRDLPFTKYRFEVVSSSPITRSGAYTPDSRDEALNGWRNVLSSSVSAASRLMCAFLERHQETAIAQARSTRRMPRNATEFRG